MGIYAAIGSLIVLLLFALVRKDRILKCNTCGRYTAHTCTYDTDEDVETCTQCGTTTIIKYRKDPETNKWVETERIIKIKDRTPKEKKRGRPPKGEEE